MAGEYSRQEIANIVREEVALATGLQKNTISDDTIIEGDFIALSEVICMKHIGLGVVCNNTKDLTVGRLIESTCNRLKLW
jgi:hypothetical protein